MNQTNKKSVIRDANGVPLEWTLLKVGENELVQDGKPGILLIGPEDLEGILAYQKTKGEKIPVDSNHYLYELARAKGVEESEVLKLLPSGVAAMGFGIMHVSGGELRFRAEWSPLAYELMREKIFRYFSPVIRGLKKGPLRITSVAMENEPALNALEELAASAHNRTDKREGQTAGKEKMEKMEKALAHLLGRDSVALGAEEDGTTADAVESKANLLASIRKGLNLADDVNDEVLLNALNAVIGRINLTEQLQKELAEQKTEVERLRLSAETEERARLIRQGLADGKLSQSLVESWAGKQDCAALAEYLKHAPAIVPLAGRILPNEADKCPEKEIELTDADLETIRRFGYDESEYRKTKKELSEDC